MAAVLGWAFRLEDVADMLGERPAALLPMVEETLANGIVIADDEAFSFCHPLLRRAVSGMIPLPARSALHHQAQQIIAGYEDPDVGAGPLAVRAPASEQPPGTRPPSPAELLSEREAEVLRWLNSQLSLREIASKLFVSYYTVKTHTRHIYRKLGVSNRQQAVAWTQT
jgi:DNA-binding CsgD family transcriptional regulator